MELRRFRSLRRSMDPLPRNRSRHRLLGGRGWRGPLLRVRRNAHQRRLRRGHSRLPRYWILALSAVAVVVAIGSSRLPRAEKIYWSIVPALGLIPHIPFL